jgi:hypothetical protein
VKESDAERVGSDGSPTDAGTEEAQEIENDPSSNPSEGALHDLKGG